MNIYGICVLCILCVVCGVVVERVSCMWRVCVVYIMCSVGGGGGAWGVYPAYVWCDYCV